MRGQRGRRFDKSRKKKASTEIGGGGGDQEKWTRDLAGNEEGGRGGVRLWGWRPPSLPFLFNAQVGST